MADVFFGENEGIEALRERVARLEQGRLERHSISGQNGQNSGQNDFYTGLQFKVLIQRFLYGDNYVENGAETPAQFFVAGVAASHFFQKDYFDTLDITTRKALCEAVHSGSISDGVDITDESGAIKFINLDEGKNPWYKTLQLLKGKFGGRLEIAAQVLNPEHEVPPKVEPAFSVYVSMYGENAPRKLAEDRQMYLELIGVIKRDKDIADVRRSVSELYGKNIFETTVDMLTGLTNHQMNALKEAFRKSRKNSMVEYRMDELASKVAVLLTTDKTEVTPRMVKKNPAHHLAEAFNLDEYALDARLMLAKKYLEAHYERDPSDREILEFLENNVMNIAKGTLDDAKNNIEDFLRFAEHQRTMLENWSTQLKYVQTQKQLLVTDSSGAGSSSALDPAKAAELGSKELQLLDKLMEAQTARSRIYEEFERIAGQRLHIEGKLEDTLKGQEATDKKIEKGNRSLKISAYSIAGLVLLGSLGTNLYLWRQYRAQREENRQLREKLDSASSAIINNQNSSSSYVAGTMTQEAQAIKNVLSGEVFAMRREKDTLAAEIGNYKAESATLSGEVGALRAEGQRLLGTNNALTDQNLRLADDRSKLQIQVAHYTGQVTQLEKQLLGARTEIKNIDQLYKAGQITLEEKNRRIGEQESLIGGLNQQKDDAATTLEQMRKLLTRQKKR